MGFRSAIFVLGIAVAASHGDTAAKDKADQLASSASSLGGGNAALLDQLDRLTGAAALPIGASASIRDAGNDFTAQVSTTPAGFRGFSGFPLGISSLGITSIGGSANLLDGSSTAISTAGPGVLLTSINTTSDWRITATPDLIVGDRIELLSASGGPVSDITINPDGTFTRAIGSTVVSFVVRVWSITDQDWGGSAIQLLELTGTLVRVDQADRMQGTGGPVIGAAVSLREQNDRAAGAGAISLGFSGSLQDSQEGVSAAVAAAIAAAVDARDKNDMAASAAVLAVSIGGAAQDLPDLISSLSGSSQAVIESALRESADHVTGEGVSAIAIESSVTDLAERIAATSVLPVAVVSGLLEMEDGVISVLAVARSASVQITDSQLELLANQALAVVGDFTGLDRASLLSSNTSLLILETAGGFVAQLVLPARTFPLSIPARTFILSPSAKPS